MDEEVCDCGDTAVTYCPVDNQSEPNCWVCYAHKEYSRLSIDDSEE